MPRTTWISGSPSCQHALHHAAQHGSDKANSRGFVQNNGSQQCICPKARWVPWAHLQTLSVQVQPHPHKAQVLRWQVERCYRTWENGEQLKRNQDRNTKYISQVWESYFFSIISWSIKFCFIDDYSWLFVWYWLEAFCQSPRWAQAIELHGWDLLHILHGFHCSTWFCIFPDPFWLDRWRVLQASRGTSQCPNLNAEGGSDHKAWPHQAKDCLSSIPSRVRAAGSNYQILNREDHWFGFLSITIWVIWD